MDSDPYDVEYDGEGNILPDLPPPEAPPSEVDSDTSTPPKPDSTTKPVSSPRTTTSTTTPTTKTSAPSTPKTNTSTTNPTTKPNPAITNKTNAPTPTGTNASTTPTTTKPNTTTPSTTKPNTTTPSTTKPNTTAPPTTKPNTTTPTTAKPNATTPSTTRPNTTSTTTKPNVTAPPTTKPTTTTPTTTKPNTTSPTTSGPDTPSDPYFSLWQQAHASIEAGHYYIKNRINDTQLVVYTYAARPRAVCEVWTYYADYPYSERKWEIRRGGSSDADLFIVSSYTTERFLAEGPQVYAEKNAVRMIPVPHSPGWYYIAPNMSNPLYVIIDPNPLSTPGAATMVHLKDINDDIRAAQWQLLPAKP